jgi:hypothetical protein
VVVPCQPGDDGHARVVQHVGTFMNSPI